MNTDKKIYVASKTFHAPIWLHYRDKGIPINSTWIDEAYIGDTKDFSDLWKRCILEASVCSALICYRMPCEIWKGAFIEIGAALGNNKPVYCIGDFTDMSFTNHPLVTHVGSFKLAFDKALSMEDGK